jgi:hypothetical protein
VIHNGQSIRCNQNKAGFNVCLYFFRGECSRTLPLCSSFRILLRHPSIVFVFFPSSIKTSSFSFIQVCPSLQCVNTTTAPSTASTPIHTFHIFCTLPILQPAYKGISTDLATMDLALPFMNTQRVEGRPVRRRGQGRFSVEFRRDTVDEITFGRDYLTLLSQYLHPI